MNYIPEYHRKVAEMLDLLSGQTEEYKKAGRLIAEAVKNKKLIHVIGTEMHSSIAAEEVFFRTGSFANINPLYDPTFSVSHSAARSLYLKEADSCGRFLIECYRNIQQGDLMIIIDTDGIGKACIEVVEKSREMGLKTIGIAPVGCAV
ncbi:MAG: SIS domain-containing protein, partial [Clostridiaceae bacterium]|nr:SIS domain-containing protein [Clostridiaceae bacterium]